MLILDWMVYSAHQDQSHVVYWLFILVSDTLSWVNDNVFKFPDDVAIALFLVLDVRQKVLWTIVVNRNVTSAS